MYSTKNINSQTIKGGKKVALRRFSMVLEKGKIYGLLGPNGAGKTTFLSIITGDVDQTEGEAYVKKLKN